MNTGQEVCAGLEIIDLILKLGLRMYLPLNPKLGACFPGQELAKVSASHNNVRE